MIQTEVQRQFYLSAAGIRLWYARQPLPGAAPSPEFRLPKLDEPIHSSTPDLGSLKHHLPKGQAPSPREDKKGAQRIASLQALVGGSTKATQAESKQQDSPAASGAPLNVSDDTEQTGSAVELQATQVLNLSLGVFAGANYVLVAHVSKEASLRLQETLAINILKSLGEVQPRPLDWVRWPVFNNPLVPGNSAAGFVAVLRHVLRDAGDRKIVVLGGQSSFVGEAGAENGWVNKALERSPDLTFDHSLTELASNHGLKRSLWHQLKLLVAK
ncbi:2-isopropylmalate synthase [Marinobacter sp. 1-4A]|uniref:2-isopropylmalate synthase n=1 Tax=Marinobacter sp. 1-4A TaxID=2582919 RepID=UPI001907CB10|nr:2-isopropylmalate synthase [Marinobacter sp. 1-4A]MBK1853213.1 2-isopropylmalate synthase [Marinobacter sp. 1-4A]